ncbi:Calcium-dependent protein kinase 17 [Apostasia shenzhenica]|uniref:non-specific serine/threonine protein kinase n=1 Tax=Apostasia shenzhenica TaxID=1088818 RepID=A0A2H9ZSE3_9ASPA|nr:Calcium-dependent protein kinase 17 [Apostasia shenzhenica]
MGISGVRFCCYKVPGLSSPILETSQISYLGDRYVLREELGWGQFGVIRACSDLVTGEALACKSISKDRLVSSDDVRSVKLEIEIMALLSGHPNVVDLKAVYEEKDFVHLVMELCAGGELFHRLEKHGRFSERDAAVLFRHLMEVVMYCHDMGIVHRDLKPENILLATKSSSSPIKLADFGLATHIKPGQSLHGTVGSPFYIAPEVLAGGYNQAADVWSAGVILYILLCGMPPFWGKTKSRIFDAVRSSELRFPSDPWVEVSDYAKQLVVGMLCRDPLQRLTAKQVLEHPWIQEHSFQLQITKQNPAVTGSKHENLAFFSLSTPITLATRDLSFGFTLAVGGDSQQDHSSPPFTCCASLASLHADVIPSLTSGFSFINSCHSSCLVVSPPIASIPSFSFLSYPLEEQENTLKIQDNEKKTSPFPRGNFLNFVLWKLFEVKQKEADVNCRALGLRNKRNHTIGSGELEQLDLIVSESVIRWASCTHLPTAASLRSSLVC